MDKEKRTTQGKYIFIAIAVCLLVLTAVSVFMAVRDNKMHEEYLELYQEANRVFEEQEYLHAEQYYRELLQIYPDSYILELKLSICALQLENRTGALRHAKRALELHPLLATDPEFMNILVYCYEYFGDDVNLKLIEDYQSGYVGA